MNDIIFRALVTAGVPSVKKPSSLFRSDGRRSDGVTQIPWTQGKCLAWDVTVTVTLAPSYVHLSSVSAGRAAERAADNKVTKYACISNSHSFIPIAFETLEPINQSALDFLSALGRRLLTTSGDVRESSFLFQRLSVTLQRFNCIAFSNTFESSQTDDH